MPILGPLGNLISPPRRADGTPRRRPLRLVLAWALLSLSATPATAAEAPSLAIYPGANPPVEGLAWFDHVAVDPAKASDAELAQLKQRGVLPVAIVGGAEATKAASNPLPMLDKLAGRGFAGYLFDGRLPTAAGPVESLVREARRRYPSALVYLRGLESRLPSLQQALSGYVTDGVFTQASPSDGTAGAPAMLDDLEGVRRLARLNEVRRRYRFPFIVADRVPVGHREQARGIARTLIDNGFMPYITVGGRGLGIGLKEHIPRRILALYDGDEESYLPATAVHRGLSVPLEYHGYVIDYVDVRKGLPAGDLASRYAGVVTWFGDDEMPQPRTYEAWFETQITTGLRIAVLGRMGFAPTAALLNRMGIAETRRRLEGPIVVASAGKMIGWEARPVPLLRGLPNWRALEGDVHLELRDAQRQSATPVMTGAWGGMALAPYLIDHGLVGRVRWIIDPFAFLSRALDFEPMPVPDTTTENARRLLFIHIDGDGFASIAEMPPRLYSGQVIQRDFLERYPFPTTVSIVEGDTAAHGLYPQLSEKLEGLAREMFKLPNVELASHSFAHPFDWTRAARGETGISKETGDPVMTPVPNYKYSAAREVGGSIRYINERLAPPGKVARVFLWSGSALPEWDALKEIAVNKLYNMNGGNAETPLDSPSLSQVTSLGRFVEGVLQVYSQAQNENVYTNEWRGPFYGFRRVIDMFKYTETPRRLKPINIYYHFYSGTKLAGVTALHAIYDYAMEQDTMPIVVSEMVQRAEDFFRVTLARRLDGGWELRGFNTLRTVRLDKRLGWPNIVDSKGVAGVEDLVQGRYVALTGEGAASLAVQANRPTVPHLASANAAIVSWSRDRDVVKFQLKGHVPVDMTVAGCTPSGGVGGARVRVDNGKRTARLTFPATDTREVTLTCR